MPCPMTLYSIKDMELQTDRLILRQWQSSDLPVLSQINLSKLAIEHFPNQLSRSASDDLAARLANEIATCGWGMWAVKLKSKSTFIGFVGLSTPLTQFPFSLCVEIRVTLSTLLISFLMSSQYFAFYQTTCLRKVLLTLRPLDIFLGKFTFI